MLIQKEPDRWEKLEALTKMAVDDVLSPNTQAASPFVRVAPEYLPSGDGRFPESHQGPHFTGRAPYSDPKKNPAPGVYRASMPNGKFINLFRTMLTDFCMMDCHYCPNSHWVPRKRFAFKVDELARTFDDLQSRHTVDGFFLSSGIFNSGSKTTERMVQVIETVRKKYGFKGYVHLKVMPGTDKSLVEEAHKLGTRLSVNIETATVPMLERISPMKDMQRGILDPMKWIDRLTRQATGGAVGQATQMVVGAAQESDQDIFGRVRQLYADWKLKRVYYVAFRPVRYTPFEDRPAVSLVREHRLYQMDWLKRVYTFSDDEVAQAFDQRGFLSEQHDPKTVIALENVDAFPLDLNSAPHEKLLRVPGIGPLSAERIVRLRRAHKIDTWRDLQAIGVVRKRAWPFIVFPGHKPDPGTQLHLDIFREGRDAEGASLAEGSPATSAREAAAAYAASGMVPDNSGAPRASQASVAPCGETKSCNGCPMYGAPGHPGSASYVLGKSFFQAPVDNTTVPALSATVPASPVTWRN